MRLRTAVLRLWLPSVLLASGLAAQVVGPLDPDLIDDELLEQRIAVACAAAKGEGKLVEAKVLAAQAAQAGTCELTVLAPRTAPLPSADLRASLLPSVRIVGHYFLCKECDEWHFSGASGFCIDDQGSVVTCAHVVAPDDTMRQAFLVVADLRGNVWPVVKVAAAAALQDVCVLQTTERATIGLPLRGTVRAGERIWCLSHPDHQFAFFSEGLIARHYLLREPPAGNEDVKDTKPGKSDLSRPALAWLHVTCDFAKGSSGAPIVDAAGNVVGIAQSTTTVVYDEEATPIDTQMVFKSAAPAAALLALLRPPKAR